MSVKIGHASISENGTITGNAGDNNGKEVFTRDWYLHSKGWIVLRCKDAEKREKIAEAMEKACKNDDIGYDQNQRDTLFNNVKTKGFDPSKTTKKVETDCSALVRVCIAYAFGTDVAGNIRTVTEPTMLTNTGYFTKYTGDKYCKSSDYLLRGDILCTPVSGHTVVVLSDGVKVTNSESTTKPATNSNKVDPAKSFDKSLSKSYTTTSALNLRSGAGTGKTILTVIPKGDKVTCYGYYTNVNGTKWLLVAYKDYTGFCSSKYLKAV